MGERPIGLMAMLFRFAMRLHKGLIGQWDEAFHGHWDQAVRNSSYLRAAILRALKVEVGYLEGFDSLAILWDIAAFYDSIGFATWFAWDWSDPSLPSFSGSLCLAIAAQELSRSASSLGPGCKSLISALLLAASPQSPTRGTFCITSWRKCTELTSQCK